MADRQTPGGLGRRTFLVRAIAAIHAAMGATLTFILGGAILAPSFQRKDSSWLRAASVDALRDDEPLAVTLRLARQDGFTQAIDRVVVYLVKQSDGGVRALSSTCTHLGCRTSYDRRSKRIVCPCHGGAYDMQGHVVDGPPPAPLPALETRVEGDEILVRV
jgi:quinol---cytochrome c reductase iron-sulfur subunit, bacillus type